MATASQTTQAFRSLIWLDDAPLFIDGMQLRRFYDAVVQPSYVEQKKTVAISKESAKSISTKLGMEGELSPGGAAKFLKAFLDAKLKASGDIEGQYDVVDQSSETVELIPIETPERQLKQLTTHYLAYHDSRLLLVPDVREDNWRSPNEILDVPRALAFIDLPSKSEAEIGGRPEVKLIPTAAEFQDGAVIPLFVDLARPNGERPPKYPEFDQKTSELRKKRKVYWQWFEESFSAQQAMQIVEKAATEHGRIRWIDFRLPLTHEGDTLHLHICPSEKFDTGVFAYNFIKRGFTHGLRIVGTLKSEPDMNVLAIYEK